MVILFRDPSRSASSSMLAVLFFQVLVTVASTAKSRVVDIKTFPQLSEHLGLKESDGKSSTLHRRASGIAPSSLTSDGRCVNLPFTNDASDRWPTVPARTSRSFRQETSAFGLRWTQRHLTYGFFHPPAPRSSAGLSQHFRSLTTVHPSESSTTTKLYLISHSQMVRVSL